ncbi:U3 snoRNP protein [Recurvomyces mirabilis]|uniref:U3 snoRNP protein n=1 Tax=Recurvomyces mirabilis TaxID=574656 RepID=A0AAE0TPJ7_9PEZI|nr:U3 snoRNP protein [Recurvomyces mirabilis]KAK5159607.1 U3 snoRNP protein [Recurvomyces mirabilis]
MASASDKARFYLEQSVPELQDYERKGIFTRPEITAITTKRSDFEHILNARGSKPGDYARYAEYEQNLDSLRKKRCKRLGIKGAKTYSGQRTVFFILDRGTKKFPGDLGLWMEYIRFCQREKANKKLARVLTSVLRLRPREWGLWVVAAKWYAEEQGDMQTARSYMQRGLRFCRDRRELWGEFVRLEMVFLAKLGARRRILGLDEEGKEAAEEVEQEDENTISLPAVTAADFKTEEGKGMEVVDAAALQKLAKAPAFSGAIPIAIFDAAMKEFKNDPEVAEMLVEIVTGFTEAPATKNVLQHAIEHLQTTKPTSPEAILCEARLYTQGIDATSAEFPVALGTALKHITAGMASLPAKHQPMLMEKAVAMLLPFLARADDLDEDVATVIMASLNRYLGALAKFDQMASIKRSIVRTLVARVRESGGRLALEDVREAVGETKTGAASS